MTKLMNAAAALLLMGSATVAMAQNNNNNNSPGNNAGSNAERAAKEGPGTKDCQDADMSSMSAEMKAQCTDAATQGNGANASTDVETTGSITPADDNSTDMKSDSQPAN